MVTAPGDEGGKFVLFGLPHLAVLVSLPVVAMLLARLARSSPARGRAVRVALGVFLAVNELTWWAWRLNAEGFRFPEALPLQLCDLTVWAAVIACLTLNRWAVEVTYYLGLSATLLTVVTPDLWAPCWTYPTMYFFAAHGSVVVAALMLPLSGLARPQPGSVLRALIVVHAWAALAGTFNLIHGTNYMYLCRKPDDATILDLLGPWPWYIASGEAIAIVAFFLLWLPWRARGR